MHLRQCADRTREQCAQRVHLGQHMSGLCDERRIPAEAPHSASVGGGELTNGVGCGHRARGSRRQASSGCGGEGAGTVRRTVAEAGHTGTDIGEIVEPVPPGVANRSHWPIELAGELRCHLAEGGNLRCDAPDVCGDVDHFRLRPREDRISVVQGRSGGGAGRYIDNRYSDEVRARPDLRVRVATHVWQGVFEHFSYDQQSLEGIDARWPEIDVLDQALLAPGEPDLRSRQDSARIVRNHIQGHFLAMQRADARKEQNEHRDHGNGRCRDQSHREVSPVQSVWHAANINARYSERLFYGPYMTVKNTASW